MILKPNLFTSEFKHVTGIVNKRTDMLSRIPFYFVDFAPALAFISSWNEGAAGDTWCHRNR